MPGVLRTSSSARSSWGRAGVGSDAGGYRSEFLGLVEKARPLLQ